MIKLGQRVRFDLFQDISVPGYKPIKAIKYGTIVYINEENRWFSVEYGKDKRRFSFKFDDVGRAVFFC